ncbi:MAG: ABC-F family ATP-binding cassette domain-containing protein [Patescibacteria group bacterium]
MPTTLLSVQDIAKTYGPRTLLEGVSFHVAEGEHIGFIGRNGAGKSTLLKIITGQETSDSGAVEHMPQLQLGYLEQHEDFLPGETVRGYLERKSGKPEWECDRMAGRFDLKKERLNTVVLTLSGGFRMRVKLAAMLLEDPNLLLLDEPTNYLDLPTQLLFEEFLRTFRGAFIIISHDRELLKRTCDITLEVERGTVERYSGNIEEWFAYKEERRLEKERHNRTIEAERRHMQEFVDRFRAKASKATQAQERLKRLAKLEQIDIVQPLKTSRIMIPPTSGRGGVALRLQDLSIGYGERVIAEHIDLELNRGNRVALLGENGQGKSTLLKTLAGEIPLLAGHVRWGHKLNIAWYAQHVHEALDGRETLGAFLTRSGGGYLYEDILRLAGNFLFSIDDLDKPCSMLSGGEKARACLAGLLLGKPDVLLLDEPTNHLDMETVEALGDALREWNGTVILVSHSRTFVHLVATTIWDVHDGQVKTYPGTYEEYIWQLKYTLGLVSEPGEMMAQVETVAKSTRAERYQELKKKRQNASKLETTLVELGKEKRKLYDEILANPTEFSRERNERITTIETMIRFTEDEWIKVQEELKGMES